MRNRLGGKAVVLAIAMLAGCGTTAIPNSHGAEHRPPSPNVAPTDPLSIVHSVAKASWRSLDVMLGGLIPNWAEDIKSGFSTFNARAEEVELQAGLPRGVPAAPMPDDARTRRPAVNGAGGFVGNLALAGGRARAQLHNPHQDTERIVRRASQPDDSLPQAGGLVRSRLLTGAEMDQITAGSAGAINGAEARALGSSSQVTASTSALVASRGSTIAGAPFQNAASSNSVSSQVTASASNGQIAEAGGSSHVFADGGNGGAQIERLQRPQSEQATHKSACASLLLARLVRISFSARALLSPAALPLPKLKSK